MVPMKEGEDSLLSIGRFSDMTRLSIKALRLYDEIGLLDPSHVDPSNGYRYYGRSQSKRADAIRLLRSVDMPLEDIKQLLDSAPEKRDALMEQHRDRLDERLAAQQRILASFHDMLEGKEPIMPFDVTRKEVPSQHVASVTSEVSIEEIPAAVGSAFGTIMQTIGGAGMAPSGVPFIVMHDVIDEETRGNIEMCIPVAGRFDASGQVESKEMHGGTAASTIHKGPYHEVAPAYHALSTWMEANDWYPCGPPREVYLNDPQEVGPGEQLTEIQWPIEKTNLH